MTGHRPGGFSLIEMAVVLFIVVLLLGSLLVPFNSQVEQRRVAETQKILEEAKEALIGYAIANGRLPCPDLRSPAAGHTPNDGLEDRAPTGNCVAQAGNLPWAELGVAKTDAWGRLFRYAVSPEFSQAISLTSSPTLTVKSRDANGNSIAVSKVNGVPAVVLSHGKNGYGGIDGDGMPAAPVPPQNADETTNATSTQTFYARPSKGPQTPCNDNGTPLCEFDDIVTWLSPSILLHRLIAAGRLP